MENTIKKILSHPQFLGQFRAIRKKVYTFAAQLEVTAHKSKEPVAPADRQELNFLPIKHKEIWGDKFDCCWFRVKGTVPESCKGKHVVALLNVGGEGAVYREGEVTQGITAVLSIADVFQTRIGKQTVELFDSAAGGEKVDMEIDAGYNGINGMFIFKPKLRRAEIAVVDDEAYAFYYDYLALALLSCTYGDNEMLDEKRHNEVTLALKSSYRAFIKGDIAQARRIAENAYGEKKEEGVVFTAIGHAHLDLAWLWPIRESKRKAVRTFATAINNFEKYPSYIFGASQAQMFDWVKNNDPVLYEKVKENVKKGRIEVQGNMWTECDCNLNCGESLIRQFIYGDKFFIDEMGVRSLMVWLPDVFGFPATLPQIIKGVGKEYFMTIKLSWNIHNRFPHQSFIWAGPDGSEIVAHIAPEGNYNSDAMPISIASANKKYIEKETGKALLIYGVGDGGGGPGEGHLELIERNKKLEGVNRVRQGSAQGFFEELAKCNLKKYQGELYLEKHQGTYTAQGATKLYNRLMERNLHNVEWLQAVTGDKTGLDGIWKEVLLYQFHDIIPGSSINRVYAECLPRYEAMYKETGKLAGQMLDSLGEKAGLTPINPTSFTRKEYVKHNAEWYNVECGPYASGKAEFFTEETAAAGNGRLENNYLKVEFDTFGAIKSMYDKEKNREYSAKGLNKLMIYPDKRQQYDAWDICEDYLKATPKQLRAVFTKFYIDGPCAVAESNYAYNRSAIMQKVILCGNKVTFETKADWHEKRKMLRAEFMPTIFGPTVNCDIQFGSIDRSTKDETSVEKAQFEICAQKYAAVHNSKGYFALINDCKYGHRVKNGMLSLNLLRSPKYPDKECDMGAHSFGYEIAVYDNIKEVVERAYAYNNPILMAQRDIKIEPIITLNQKDIIIETIKPAEDGKGIAVRMYERYGKKTETKFEISVPYKKTYECNLAEENLTECGNDLVFTPHQIKTLYIEL